MPSPATPELPCTSTVAIFLNDQDVSSLVSFRRPILVFVFFEFFLRSRLPRQGRTTAPDNAFLGWDPYAGCVSGQPEITILKIAMPPNTALDWHQHPMINAA